jgi:hypothetical protein
MLPVILDEVNSNSLNIGSLSNALSAISVMLFVENVIISILLAISELVINGVRILKMPVFSNLIDMKS